MRRKVEIFKNVKKIYDFQKPTALIFFSYCCHFSCLTAFSELPRIVETFSDLRGVVLESRRVASIKEILDVFPHVCVTDFLDSAFSGVKPRIYSLKR